MGLITEESNNYIVSAMAESISLELRLRWCAAFQGSETAESNSTGLNYFHEVIVLSDKSDVMELNCTRYGCTASQVIAREQQLVLDGQNNPCVYVI